MSETMSRTFWMNFRQGLLLIVDAVERELCISPRTSQLRKEKKAERLADRADVRQEQE